MGDAPDDREPSDRCSRAAGDRRAPSGSSGRPPDDSGTEAGAEVRPDGGTDERTDFDGTGTGGTGSGGAAGRADGTCGGLGPTVDGPPADAGGSRGGSSSVADAVSGLHSVLRTSVVTGAAVTLPLLITVLVLALVASVLSDVVRPFVVALSWLPVGPDDARILEALTLVSLLVGTTVVGYVAAYWTSPERLERPVEAVVTAVPGVGPVYETFSEMSEFIVDSDASCFQEVVLVEYPTEGSYALAFETAEPPAAIEDATPGEEMLTVFVPMAPNPVMGGFVLHVSPAEVIDVDLTVEEGIQSIITSGVATGTPVHEQPAALADGDGGRSE